MAGSLFGPARVVGGKSPTLRSVSYPLNLRYSDVRKGDPSNGTHVGPQMIFQVPGPGVITAMSVTVNLNPTVSAAPPINTPMIGFALINHDLIAGSSPLWPASTPPGATAASDYWPNTFPGGDSTVQYTIPALEIVNAAQQGGISLFSPGNTQGGTIVYSAATSFTAGEIISYQNAFSNGSMYVGDVRLVGPPSWGDVYGVSYSLYSPLQFSDQLRVYLSSYYFFPGVQSQITVNLVGSASGTVEEKP